MAEKYKIQKKSLKALLIWIIAIAIFLLLVPLIKYFSPLQPADDSDSCPSTILGNQDANFQIKYFYSSNCLHCMGEEIAINSLIREKGNIFSVEKYNIEFCSDEASKFGVVSTPSFVFFDKKTNEYFTRNSYLPRDALENTVCKSTGSCF
ncbi:thioredoxin family protein [Candidatus Woesearchaeota archaeon]|nr:thioredoxin family protein [Candidatus Woesearchaeota archaeon]